MKEHTALLEAWRSLQPADNFQISQEAANDVPLGAELCSAQI